MSLIRQKLHAKIYTGMLRKQYTWLAIIAIIAVLIIFIAPSVDLAPTALRAWGTACAVFFAIAATISTVVDCSSSLPVSRAALNASGGTVISNSRQLSSVLLC